MTNQLSVYWDDLASDLEDPEFLREFVLESIRVQTVDAIVNQLDEAREAASLSKAALARAISSEPATVRRLLGAAAGSNPTIGTVAELAAALGYRLTLEPIPGRNAGYVSDALLTGRAANVRRLVDGVEASHERRRSKKRKTERQPA
jgi:transcriptional regulator with XRE-family HTH domain